jgi:hypothetical protein
MRFNSFVARSALLLTSFVRATPVTVNAPASTTNSPSAATAFPLTQAEHYTLADICARSCARVATSLWSEKLTCSGDNPATCVCQSWGLVAATAHSCASVSCGASASGDEVRAKLAIYDYCSSNGLFMNSQTTILPALLMDGKFSFSMFVVEAKIINTSDEHTGR